MQQTPLVTLSRRFSFNMSFNCTSRDEYSTLIVWPFRRQWMRRMPSWSQKNRGENFPRKSLRLLAPLTFLIRVEAVRDPLRGELPHVQIVMNDGPNPLTWDAQLLSYWFSRNPAVFQDYLVNLINKLRVGRCFVLSRTRRITGGKITTFKWGRPVSDGGIRWCMFP